MLGQFTTNPILATSSQPAVIVNSDRSVTLVDGRSVAIDGLSQPALKALQQEQEPAFAQAIQRTAKDSPERAETIRIAYATVCSILDEMAKRQARNEVFSMGMDARYAELVMRLLESQTRKGIQGGLFELGCSAGGLLAKASQSGFRVGGLEVVPELLDQTRQRISNEYHSNLFLGDFRCVDLTHQLESYSVAYWNDVFEHIPTDEIVDYLARLFSILKPGGVLITITPNWHMRPSDVTAAFLPPRNEAQGFHLKEYTLREVTSLLSQVGFEQIQTPSFISRNKIHTQSCLSLTKLKCLFEPTLELMPFSVAVQFCRRLGLSCTIATKPTK
jgi:2-polyprenyl-3-methyl-5-hydroxy-6-metoxy-1,4-benzoquinol methylase